MQSAIIKQAVLMLIKMLSENEDTHLEGSFDFKDEKYELTFKRVE